MTPELTALTFAVLVQIASLGWAQMQMNRELGVAVNAGPRDRLPEFSPLLGRLRRAVQNGVEGLAMFTPAILVVTLAGSQSTLTAIAAWVYVATRILYTPAYALGLSPGRSLIWGIGFFAILTLLVSALI